jgi:hypothetical protein
MSAYAEVLAPCSDCTRSFPYSVTDQRAADELGFDQPGRCPACRLALDASRGPTLPQHAHHWLIAGQTGPTSEATCKTCDATRTFNNAYYRTYRSTVFLNSRTRPPVRPAR